MKKLIAFVVLMNSFFSFAQKNELQSNSREKFYGSLFGDVELKSGKPSVGMGLGFQPLSYFGLGGGVEVSQMRGFKTPNRLATSTYGELRLFANTNKLRPSIAFQYGQFIYNDGFDISSSSIVSQTVLTGKALIGGNINFCFTLNNKKDGFSIGYSYRSIKFVSKTNTLVINTPNPNTKYSNTSTFTSEYGIITLGYNF